MEKPDTFLMKKHVYLSSESNIRGLAQKRQGEIHGAGGLEGILDQQKTNPTIDARR